MSNRKRENAAKEAVTPPQDVDEVLVVVIRRFVDKYDHKTYHEVGAQLTVTSQRAEDLKERGLAVIVQLPESGEEDNATETEASGEGAEEKADQTGDE